MVLAFENGRFNIRPDQEIVRKAAPEAEVLRLLRSFLDTNEPSLVRILVNTWNAQGRAITYKELREAILNGDISVEYWEDWQQDYARLVTQYLQPAWEKAIAAGVQTLQAKYPTWHFDPMADGVRQWVANHGAEFVTNSTRTQIEGLQAVVQRAAALEDLSVDELSRVIRPMVGLTKQQANANLNYYNNLIANGVKANRAQDLSIRYAARQHRYRGYNIARSELAYAYNKGAHEGVKQAQEAGYMGEVVKVWCCADDERICSYCGGLEGKTIAMDEEFDFKTRLSATNPGIRLTPPAHPSCRCAIMYKEVAPPRFK